MPEGYAVPKSGGQYMKFKDGANKFRIGVMANKELRGWRIKAHEHVDQLWKTKRLKRPTLYRRLNDWFGKEVHIGEADIEMCRKIIAIPLELLAPKASDRKRKSRLTRAAFRHAHQRAEEPAPWRAVMDRTSSEDADMDDVEKRAKEIIDEYGYLTTGEEAQIQEFKQAVQDFLKKGPGMSEQRRQALLKHMTGWAPQFKDFLVSPN